HNGGERRGSLASFGRIAMETPRYPIPAQTTRVELRIVNSRFIATAGEARTVEEAKAFIDAIREEFHDATHNVYAYRVGYGATVTEGMSDDGEPAGTAGRPALTVLRGADLGDVVVVVTRYFEIGRASCRERGETEGGDGSSKRSK